MVAKELARSILGAALIAAFAVGLHGCGYDEVGNEGVVDERGALDNGGGNQPALDGNEAALDGNEGALDGNEGALENDGVIE